MRLLAGWLVGLALLFAWPAGGGVGRLRAVPRARAPRTVSGAGTRSDVPIPVVLDLVAAVLSAGVPTVAAVRLVAQSLAEAGDPGATALAAVAAALSAPARGANPPRGVIPPRGRPREPLAAAVPATVLPLLEVLELADATGSGPVSFVLAAADEQRRRRRAAQSLAARRLAVLVVLPTGLCLLPAFVLLTVAPLVIDLLLG